MGSVLSFYEDKTNTEEITECDEFHDAMDNLNTTDHLETDAIEKRICEAYVSSVVSSISYEEVRDIESELSFYEKVSLIFLLNEQEDIALQLLLVEQANVDRGLTNDLISNWARSKHCSKSSWKNQFIEALCIIQNYALLRKLGYDKEEMMKVYLPNQPYTSIHLNVVQKALYCLCEYFSSDYIKQFLKYLAEDFQSKHLEFPKYNENYLEMYLLHCLSIKYIKLNDLTNLIKILKKMGLLNKAEMLGTVLKIVNNSQTSEDQAEKRKNPEFSVKSGIDNYKNEPKEICSGNSIIGDNSIVRNHPSSDVYKIDPEHVGICLIINQKKFYKENLEGLDLSENLEYINVPRDNLPERKGTDVDRDTLSKTFSKLGFRIRVLENLNHRQMLPEIRKVIQEFSGRDSCFVVCVLSHGIAKEVYASNSVPVSISKLTDALHDRQSTCLLGKPKILIIQSCQGKAVQKVYRLNSDENVTDGPLHMAEDDLNLVNDETGVPEKRDLLVCMSTVSGFASIRNESEGTWYIQELCKTIDEECNNNHFIDILTKVTNKVSNKRWKKEGNFVTMVPEFKTSFEKKLFLPKQTVLN